MIQQRRRVVKFRSALCVVFLPMVLPAAKQPEPLALVAGQAFGISTARGSGLEPFIISLDRSDACPHFNHWKYGPLEALAYVTLDAERTWPQMEADYAQRDVNYLLGTADTDPREKDLDISCRGEAQGPTRFARGQAYYAYLHGRHPSGWHQHLWFVPGVAHSARHMFTSTCGVGALFDAGSCLDQ